MAKDLKTLTLAGATAWRMLRKDLTSYVAQVPDLAKIENLARLDEMMAKGAGVLLCLLCSANEPICQQEAETINALIGESHNAQYYNLWLKELGSRPDAYQSALNIFELVMKVSANWQLTMIGNYQPDKDRVIAAIDKMAHAVFQADDEVTEDEVRELCLLTSRLRNFACSMDHSLASQKQAISDIKPVPQPNASDIGREDSLEKCLADLHALAGLDSVKTEVETLANLAKVISIRKARGMAVPPISFHIVFTGNPGTGKTTVARIIAKIYRHLNLISKGHLVETDRSGLVANFVGQTAAKVHNVVESATGGVLFIDEAYSLVSKSENDFGAEAIETLLKLMEDRRNDLIVIAAGYADKMDAFLSSNPGLRSRFPRMIEFKDYSAPEMLEIFSRMASDSQYRLAPDIDARLKKAFEALAQNKTKAFANGREVRNLFEQVIMAQANRLARINDPTEDQLLSIEAGDIAWAGA